VTDVREGELKGRNRMTGELEFDWIVDDAARLKAKVIGYVGYFKLLSGYSKTTYWSIAELEQHGVKYSQSFKRGYGVWKDNFDAMAKKTVLKLMLNKGDAPMSVEMQQAIKYDQSVILDENGSHRYVDNQKQSAEDKLDAIAAKEQEIEDVQEVIDVETGEVLS
jgi:recombination protein RecT